MIGVHGAAAIAAESNSPCKVASAASKVTRGIIPPPDHKNVDDDARNIQDRRSAHAPQSSSTCGAGGGGEGGGRGEGRGRF